MSEDGEAAAAEAGRGNGSGGSGGAAVALSAAGLAVSVTYTVVIVVGSARFAPEVLTAVLACVAAIAPTLISAAVVALMRPALRGSTRLRHAVTAAAAVGFSMFGLAVASWSVGFDEADAGVAQSAFASAAGPLSLGALALVAGAITTLSYLTGARPLSAARRALRIGVTAIVALPVALVVLVSSVTPLLQPLVATGVLVLALLLFAARDRQTGAAAAARLHNVRADDPAAPRASTSPLHHPVARRRATLLAFSSLTLSVGIWGSALVASGMLTGQPEATTVLATAGGASHLAAIPLLWCATIVLTARTTVDGPVRGGTRSARPGRALWVATVVSTALIGAAALPQAMIGDTTGNLMFGLMPVLALAAGIWAGTAVWPLMRNTAREFAFATRAALTLALGFGSAIAYLALAGMTAGIGLVVASGLLALWGVRAALEPCASPGETSREPLPA